MCEQSDLDQWAKQAVSRREFGAFGGFAALAACAPVATGERSGQGHLAERRVDVSTPAGTMDGEFYYLAGTRNPGVLFWPDIGGIREAKRMMARRLASAGYAVLLANPYYRDVAGEQFSDIADFRARDGFAKVTPWREKLTAEAIAADAAAAAGWLDAQEAVDPQRGIGSQGYCMSGSFTIWAAAASSRIRAAGSFHGGGLVRDGGASPHRMLNAENTYLIAIARNDDASAPGDKLALREAADAAGAKAEIEVYAADHGWCVPDSPSYNEPEAERAWARLLALYKAAL